MKHAISDDALRRLASFTSHGKVDPITEAAQAAMDDFARHDPQYYRLGLAIFIASKAYGVDQSEVARKVRELQEEESIMKEVWEEERKEDMKPYTYDPDYEEREAAQEPYNLMREDWLKPWAHEPDYEREK